MILERGNMWDAFGQGIFMITTNPIVRKDGAVVMGRGIALEAKTRFPTLPVDFGNKLKTLIPYHGDGAVGWIGDYENTPIWWFMVKDHWANKASVDIITQSTNLVDVLFGDTDSRVDLNFPGIGNGGLAREEVLPIIQRLPDNIHIWEYA